MKCVNEAALHFSVKNYVFIFLRHDDSTFFYAVFDGHDGLQIAKYGAERLPAEILLDQLNETRDDEGVYYFRLY